MTKTINTKKLENDVEITTMAFGKEEGLEKIKEIKKAYRLLKIHQLISDKTYYELMCEIELIEQKISS